MRPIADVLVRPTNEAADLWRVDSTISAALTVARFEADPFDAELLVLDRALRTLLAAVHRTADRIAAGGADGVALQAVTDERGFLEAAKLDQVAGAQWRQASTKLARRYGPVATDRMMAAALDVAIRKKDCVAVIEESVA